MPGGRLHAGKGRKVRLPAVEGGAAGGDDLLGRLARAQEQHPARAGAEAFGLGQQPVRHAVERLHHAAPVRGHAPQRKGRAAPGKVAAIAPRAVETECDVRGMTLEEAILAVDMFLDGATLNRLKMVYIIHGKGTGVLRAGIQKHLKKHPAVSEFRLGRYGEGEDGVTVVTLK